MPSNFTTCNVRIFMHFIDDNPMENLRRIDRPEFVEWYLKVVDIVKETGSGHDISYKGLWVDFYDDGLTPEEAIEKKTQIS
nr:MAG TPA_asm: protein of unknown function (DUF5419) [Caudoviricetes sp.]